MAERRRAERRIRGIRSAWRKRKNATLRDAAGESRKTRVRTGADAERLCLGGHSHEVRQRSASDAGLVADKDLRGFTAGYVHDPRDVIRESNAWLHHSLGARPAAPLSGPFRHGPLPRDVQPGRRVSAPRRRSISTTRPLRRFMSRGDAPLSKPHFSPEPLHPLVASQHVEPGPRPYL
jgi:hypothetical protein